MSSCQRTDRGSLSAFVVVITVALLACGGLVIDGARIVGAKVSAADQAENAARAGAQEIQALRGGGIVIDPARATAAAAAYLDASGVTGSVTATAQRITVTVTATVTTTLLALVGVTSKTVVVSRSSTPIVGSP